MYKFIFIHIFVAKKYVIINKKLLILKNILQYDGILWEKQDRNTGQKKKKNNANFPIRLYILIAFLRYNLKIIKCTIVTMKFTFYTVMQHLYAPTLDHFHHHRNTLEPTYSQ